MFRKNGSVYGLLLGLLTVFGAYLLEGGSFKALFLLPPLIIVFGGTFSATIIGVGFDKFKKIFRLIRMAYFPPKYDIKKLIDGFVKISVVSRQEGILAAEKQLGKLIYPFPKKMMHFVMDGTDIDLLETLAMGEMKAMQGRHNLYISMFNKMGGYAPTMGIIGTVMGLIMTLANAGKDPNTLIHSIATADKLKQCHLEEKYMMEVSLEGVMAIQSGEIPSIVKSRLMSLLPQKEQGSIGIA